MHKVINIFGIKLKLKPQDLDFIQKFFSIKNIINKGKVYKQVSILGCKLKIDSGKVLDDFKLNKKSLIDKIDAADVVFFDIFDTLLLRPFIEPTDTFKYIEKQLSHPNFVIERIKAENKARSCLQSSEEITYDEIYKHIDMKHYEVKNIEQDVEKMTIYANYEMQEFYNYALKKEKKIIIASNMYFSKKFIAELLERNNYQGYYKLYVSSDEKVSKSTSNLYKKIIKDLNINPEKALMIGDNPHDDVKMANTVGLSSFLYKKPIDQFFEQNNFRYLKNLYEKENKSIEISIIISLIMKYWLKNKKETIAPDNYWKFFGFICGGPAVYGYVDYIRNISKKQHINELVFIARDGYNLQKVYNLIENNPIKNCYVYAPRIFGIKSLLTAFESEDYCQSALLFWKKNNKNFAKIIKDIDIKKLSFEQKKQLLIRYSNILAKDVNSFKQKYQKYLRNIINTNENIAMVDTIAGAFSSQTLLQNILDKKICGLYWCVNHEYEKYKTNMHYQWSKSYQIDELWDVIEILITSNESSIIDIINNKPVYSKNSSDEEIYFRHEIYPLISTGLIDFAYLLKETFGNLGLTIEHNFVCNFIKNFYYNLSDLDKLMLSSIVQAYDIENKYYFSHLDAISKKIKTIK